MVHQRRFSPAKASARLDELGAPRSVHTLRKDHREPSGIRGPRFVRDERGWCWYWESDLVEFASVEIAKLSPTNPPPPAIRSRAG
jgi:hypothetical protein